MFNSEQFGYTLDVRFNRTELRDLLNGFRSVAKRNQDDSLVIHLVKD